MFICFLGGLTPEFVLDATTPANTYAETWIAHNRSFTCTKEGACNVRF